MIIRPARGNDLDELAELARHLDTVNLPADKGLLDTMLAASVEQLNGSTAPDQAIMLVLEDDEGALRGSATIIPRHGSPQAPHCFFDVIEEQRYSPRLDKVFDHRVLRLGTSFVPRTEIGGLVLHPSCRGRGLGRLLSLSRFQFIAAYRSMFCDHVLAELLPPFDSDGDSPLWKALGQRFTGLTYRQADRLSGQEKEFIEDLFPRSDIHVSLFSPSTQQGLGTVGEETKAALKLLKAQGFFYTKRIDPFDGGPHYRARTDEIAAVCATRSAKASIGRGTSEAIIGRACDRPIDYAATIARVELAGMQAKLSKDSLAALGQKVGQTVLVTPL